MQSCLELVSNCPCEDGCPSCVGSPSRSWSYFDADSEFRERIPDKEAALMLLHDMLGIEPYEPKRPPPSERDVPVHKKRDIKPLPENVAERMRRNIRKMGRKDERS